MAQKMYTATVEGEKYEFSKEEWNTILTDNAYKLLNRMIRQGGKIAFGIGKH